MIATSSACGIYPLLLLPRISIRIKNAIMYSTIDGHVFCVMHPCRERENPGSSSVTPAWMPEAGIPSRPSPSGPLRGP